MKQSLYIKALIALSVIFVILLGLFFYLMQTRDDFSFKSVLNKDEPKSTITYDEKTDHYNYTGPDTGNNNSPIDMPPNPSGEPPVKEEDKEIPDATKYEKMYQEARELTRQMMMQKAGTMLYEFTDNNKTEGLEDELTQEIANKILALQNDTSMLEYAGMTYEEAKIGWIPRTKNLAKIDTNNYFKELQDPEMLLMAWFELPRKAFPTLTMNTNETLHFSSENKNPYKFKQISEVPIDDEALRTEQGFLTNVQTVYKIDFKYDYTDAAAYIARYKEGNMKMVKIVPTSEVNEYYTITDWMRIDANKKAGRDMFDGVDLTKIHLHSGK